MHGFIYVAAGMYDLGTLPGGTESIAISINNAGQVVGESNTATTAGTCMSPPPGYDETIGCLGDAFFYTSGKIIKGKYVMGTIYDLNDLIPTGSGWHLSIATAINNKGQITGYGTNPSGQFHAFLLTIK